jgi:hypothetical protein
MFRTISEMFFRFKDNTHPLIINHYEEHHFHFSTLPGRGRLRSAKGF